MFDPYLLDEAITNVAKQELMKKLREHLLYNSPPEFAEVFREYTRLEEERAIKIEE